MIDAGADAVIGHGPHVLRGMEFYRGRLIAYSLGNFVTYRGFNLSGPLGVTGVLQLEFAGRGPASPGASGADASAAAERARLRIPTPPRIGWCASFRRGLWSRLPRVINEAAIWDPSTVGHSA